MTFPRFSANPESKPLSNPVFLLIDSLFDSYFFFFFFSKAIERADENEIRFSKQFSRVIARLKDWDFERDSSISGRDSEIGLELMFGARSEKRIFPFFLEISFF